MKVLFCAGVSPIVRDRDDSIRFYGDTLGLPLQVDAEYDYVATGDVDGLKHLGLWRLSEAAEACFGTTQWPADVPEPQATVEFDVDDVEAAARGVASCGLPAVARAAHHAVGPADRARDVAGRPPGRA